MQLSKNKKHQYLFFFIFTLCLIFNGGNSNILIQTNFILMSGLFIFCLKDKNYNLHFKNFYNKIEARDKKYNEYEQRSQEWRKLEDFDNAEKQ